ncbi:MAG: hypothetical protein LBQ98_04970 [Nitrososphaerota archaeon]|jgi:hypothetical protein|nr:hypothetical protein [Nitrososphaerota archaeon]
MSNNSERQKELAELKGLVCFFRRNGYSRLSHCIDRAVRCEERDIEQTAKFKRLPV